MKLFLDTANLDDIVSRYETGLIAGITTNPTLVRKSGVDYHGFISTCCEAFPTLESVSVEVGGETAEEMIDEAASYLPVGSAVTIKVPLNKEGLIACKTLRDRGVKVNVTLCFGADQAILTGLAGATYISPFVGRMDDNLFGGINLIRNISEIYKAHGVETQILSASIRDSASVAQSFLNGADVCTIPPKVFDKMYTNVLTDAGLNIFNEDFKQIK